MNPYILFLKRWYDLRVMRERMLILGLSWALFYALFYFSLFRPLDIQEKTLREDIKSTNNQIKNWNVQIDALQKIADTPLYKTWVKQQKSFLDLHGKYKDLLKSASSNQWQDVIKAILQSQHNITIVQIKNFPEVAYNHTTPNTTTSATKIYEQRFLIVIYSNFFDTVNYIQRLEELLPNIHWDKLNYQVEQYPVAKVEMELSIFYEKAS